MTTGDLHNLGTTIALEKERPAGVTDGHAIGPRPDHLSNSIAAQEAGKRYAETSLVVGHVALSPESSIETNS